MCLQMWKLLEHGEKTFLELNYRDVCGIINVEGADYAGVLIDHGGNSMALKKDFLNKVKSHIKVKKN